MPENYVERNRDCWYISKCEHDSCKDCQEFMFLDWQMKNSGLPVAKQKLVEMFYDDFNKVDWDKFDQLGEVRKNILDFVRDGKNLYICGENTGNGKTSWAIRMLHTYLHYTAYGNYERLKGIFVSVPELLIRLKDFDDPTLKSYKKQIESVDLVIWDDIAISGASQFDYLQLYALINNRVFAEKSNIFTSNQTSDENLEKLLGKRLSSRIWGVSTVITLEGQDRR